MGNTFPSQKRRCSAVYSPAFLLSQTPFFPLKLGVWLNQNCLPLERKTEGTYLWRVSPMS